MTQEYTNEIKTVVAELLARINISATIEEGVLLDGPCFDIKSIDSNMLIGENGQHLLALHTVVKKIIERKFPQEQLPFLLDVNEYQRHRIEEIKDKARMSAQRVRYFKKEVVMQPMSAYERRIVHVALAEDPDVTTESMGEGEMRRVVIKPALTV